MYKVTNPVDGTVVEEFPTTTDSEMRAAIERADVEFHSWKDRSVTERAAIVRRAADLFTERADELAGIITLEMGKRIDEAKGEMGVVDDIFRYYADNAEQLTADEPLNIVGGKALVQKRPIGVILGIMPWNYPYYQVARFAAPNLVLGNTVILKHASNCPRSAAAIEKVLHDAGVPADAYINVYASTEQVAWVLTDPRIQGVSLTGSERAGRAVAAVAGTNLKKMVLELGGSDPMIILDSDDLDRTVEIAVDSRMGNVGQSCNAPKRMIIMADLYDDFVNKFAKRLTSYVPGDPADPATTLGPLSSRKAAEDLISQIENAVIEGATLRTGGQLHQGPGAYVQPALLTDVTRGMKAYHQELFGPVAIVFKAETEDEAIRIANDTPFGLGSSVFSTDRERAARVGARIDAGMVYVNQAGGSQADLPFGGIKASGVGRELGPLGMEEFMNKKVIRL